MLELELIEGELAERPGLDAIVNATDTELNFAGGVDMLVAHFGGPELLREAAQLAPLNLGRAARTGPGALGTRHVIHAAVTGFRFEDLNAGLRDGSLTSDTVLKKATMAALTVAHELACTRVGLPPMGRGAVGHPTDEGARAVLDAVFEYVIAKPDTSITKLEIVVRSDEMEHFVTARKALAAREREAFEAQERAERGARAARERAEQAAREAQERIAREQHERAERERAEREKADWHRQERERAERERMEREKAEWERAQRERAQMEAAALEHAARERAAMEQAAREHAARERAAMEQAAREQVAREQTGSHSLSRSQPIGQMSLGAAGKPKPVRPTMVDERAALDPPPPRRSLADEKTHIVREDGSGTTRPPPRPTARPTLLDSQQRPAAPAPQPAPQPRPETGARSVPAASKPRFVEEKTQLIRGDAPPPGPSPTTPKPASATPAGEPVEIDARLVEDDDFPSDGPTISRRRG